MSLLFIILLLGIGVLGTLYLQARRDRNSLSNQLDDALGVADAANQRAEEEIKKREEILTFLDKYLARPAQVIITPEVGHQIAHIVVDAILGPQMMPIEFIPKNPKPPEDTK